MHSQKDYFYGCHIWYKHNFLWSLFVFDDWNNGILVTWVCTSQLIEEDLIMWLEPLRRHIENDMPSFLPSCFMTDGTPKRKDALKHAWPKDEVLLYLCVFHIIKN